MKISLEKSITKTLDIAAEPKKVFDFLANPLNWPKFAVINLKTVEKEADGWYEVDTRMGRGRVKMLSNSEHRTLDHLCEYSFISWNVFMRVIPNEEGTTLINTFFQPPHLDLYLFEIAMADMDAEFSNLKMILET